MESLNNGDVSDAVECVLDAFLTATNVFLTATISAGIFVPRWSFLSVKLRGAAGYGGFPPTAQVESQFALPCSTARRLPARGCGLTW